jgi:hypothetical protein
MKEEAKVLHRRASTIYDGVQRPNDDEKNLRCDKARSQSTSSVALAVDGLSPGTVPIH